MRRRVFLGLSGAAVIAQSAAWERRPFPNWTKDDIDRLLTDSPWAKQVAVSFELQPQGDHLRSDFAQIQLPGTVGLPRVPGIGWPGGDGRTRRPTTDGGGQPSSVRSEVYLTVRWSSALPMRQAMALERFGRDGLDHSKAVELLENDPEDYTLEIFGFPATMWFEKAKQLEEDLIRSARLWADGSGAIRARSAHVPGHGSHLSAELLFPRSEAITVESGVLDFRAAAGPLKFETKFKPKSMMYEGRFEL
jgi:hypothetical protein